jgi:hypothetical protein
MRKMLFTSAAVIGIAFGAGVAHASGNGPSCNSRCSVDEVIAAALGVNIGGVYGENNGDNARAAARMTGSIRDNRGVTQANQNAGAGALQQNATAVALVTGVDLSGDEVAALAAGLNLGAVQGTNTRYNGDAAAAMHGSVRDNTGITQANQNAGAGALQQNAVALAAIEGCGADCVDVNLAATVAAAVNVGYVDGWNADCGCQNEATAVMAGSIRGNLGLTQVQQNAGAGALQQNAIAVGYVGAAR